MSPKKYCVIELRVLLIFWVLQLQIVFSTIWCVAVTYFLTKKAINLKQSAYLLDVTPTNPLPYLHIISSTHTTLSFKFSLLSNIQQMLGEEYLKAECMKAEWFKPESYVDARY